MATTGSQHIRNLGCQLGSLKKNCFNKTAGNFLEINRKHVFTASKRNIIVKEYSVKKKLEQILSKGYIFPFQTLINK